MLWCRGKSGQARKSPGVVEPGLFLYVVIAKPVKAQCSKRGCLYRLHHHKFLSLIDMVAVGLAVVFQIDS